MKAGDRVMWRGNRHDLGTVLEVTSVAVKIKWDNGALGWQPVRGSAMREDISLVPNEARP